MFNFTQLKPSFYQIKKQSTLFSTFLLQENITKEKCKIELFNIF